MRRLALAVSTCALLFAAWPEPRAEARETQLELGSAFAGYGTYMRAMPVMSFSGGESSRFVSGSVPSIGHLTLAGASGELTMAVDKRLVFPLAGLGLSAAIGESPRILSAVDGSIVEQRAWTALMADVLLPGVGVRFYERRWMFSATLRTGISFARTSAAVANGAFTEAGAASAASFLLRAEVAGCRRTDPFLRICVAVSPSIYQFGFGNAVTAGLRLEFGL